MTSSHVIWVEARDRRRHLPQASPPSALPRLPGGENVAGRARMVVRDGARGDRDVDRAQAERGRQHDREQDAEARRGQRAGRAAPARLPRRGGGPRARQQHAPGRQQRRGDQHRRHRAGRGHRHPGQQRAGHEEGLLGGGVQTVGALQVLAAAGDDRPAGPHRRPHGRHQRPGDGAGGDVRQRIAVAGLAKQGHREQGRGGPQAEQGQRRPLAAAVKQTRLNRGGQRPGGEGAAGRPGRRERPGRLVDEQQQGQAGHPEGQPGDGGRAERASRAGQGQQAGVGERVTGMRNGRLFQA